MLIETLALLRCPFCGTRLSVVENAALERGPARIHSGVLGCECCAFPVVAGIPVLLADDRTRDAMHALEAGRGDDALHLLLGLHGKRLPAFRELVASGRATYRNLLPLLCEDAEADYMLPRFSDPTYLLIEALLDSLGRNRSPASARERALDLCGGSGHVTRALLRQPACNGTVLADVHFWKLWLAARIVAPDCEPVCCDANSPLPFADRLFGTVLLSDAFPYIWHKRMLAGEMQRVATGDGVIVMPHLHSAHGENYSAGDTLSPAAYRDLFAPLEPRLFDDRPLLDGVLDERVLDLATDVSPADCGDTAVDYPGRRPRRNALYRRHDVRRPPGGRRGPDRQPALPRGLPRTASPGSRSPSPRRSTRTSSGWPSGTCPASVDADLRAAIAPADVGTRYAELRRRRILLDLPRAYC